MKDLIERLELREESSLDKLWYTIDKFLYPSWYKGIGTRGDIDVKYEIILSDFYQNYDVGGDLDYEKHGTENEVKLALKSAIKQTEADPK